MDAKILDQLSANTVGNCKIMTTSLVMKDGVNYTISDIPFVPQAIICASQNSGYESSTVIIKPMTNNYNMHVNKWDTDSIVVSTERGKTWYFIILG